MPVCRRVVIQYFLILHNITQYFPPKWILPNLTQYTQHNTFQYYIWWFVFHAALDARSRLKLYWIDLIDSARLQLDDLALASKVYHKFDFTQCTVSSASPLQRPSNARSSPFDKRMVRPDPPPHE